MTELYWLPTVPDWRERVRALASGPGSDWNHMIGLANARVNFVMTNALDEMIRRSLPDGPKALTTKKVRLAVLGSSTVTHLLPGIRVAGVRRGIWIDTYEGAYGQYLQELSEPTSRLFEFKPTAILIALDAYHLAAGVTSGMDAGAAQGALHEVLSRIQHVWRLAADTFRCPVIHQTPLLVHLPLAGNNEHLLHGSRARFLSRLNQEIRTMAKQSDVDILAVDDRVCRDGIAKWHDRGLWHRAKQEISPVAGPMYGELVGRCIAARQGQSCKCLVLDLDNTIWGGVIGDDGLRGIILGQGSALGEAYAAFQDYIRELGRRGVILAVCSKNDAAAALEPFEKHPEMVLQRTDIACFVANWSNKADNIRAIAQDLNIGLDALCFVDDNPFERGLVRQELPMVAVPELSDDPADYPATLADAGYFEAVSFTEEDRQRTTLYQANEARTTLRASVTDMPSYLRGLGMRLIWKPFDTIGLQRIVQLVNKSNQFNLTTRRYSADGLAAVMADPTAFGLQLRLTDRFGDNGIIAIIIGRLLNDDLYVDTWLMSCRVLGRQVERATLNVFAQEAIRLGARRIVGDYVPTTKNAMVKDHYANLGFRLMEARHDGGSRNILDLRTFVPAETFIQVTKG